MPGTSQDQWVETPRGRIFVRSWSPGEDAPRPRDGAPIVLLHDSLGCVELWRGFPERLCAATGRTVFAYDRLGFGRSAARAELPGLGFVREEAEVWFPVVRRELGLESFVVMGHSVGGGMAALCAATWPGPCRALVTESAQAFVEARTLEGIREAQRAFQEAGQLDRLRRYHGEKAGWVLEAWIGTWLSEAFRPWSLAPDLPRIVSPTLVIHGDQDEYGSVEHPGRIGSLVTGTAAVEILPGVHHVPHKEVEAVVVDRIARFLEAEAGSASRARAP